MFLSVSGGMGREVEYITDHLSALDFFHRPMYEGNRFCLPAHVRLCIGYVYAI